MKLIEIMEKGAEQSAGIIVYRVNDENKAEFLLLKGDAIGWGFPKGHADKGENLVQTAKRETYEESNLRISELKPGFKKEVKYFLKKNYSTGKKYDKPKLKIVTYFLAEVPYNSKVKISNEHLDFTWLSYTKAKNKMRFNSELLKFARDYIKDK